MIMTVCPLTAFAADGDDVTYVDRTWDSESEAVNSDETTLAEPTDPTDPDTPSGDNLCKWDNVDHGTSFRGRIIKFFHSVLYFFAHLFGRR